MLVSSASQQQLPQFQQQQQLSVQSSTPPRKKIKLDDNTEKITTAGLPDTEDYRLNVMKHKLKRMRVIREEYTENQTELFFLQNSGNLTDYLVWKKRPPTAQFQLHLSEHKLELDENDEKYFNASCSVVKETTSGATNTTASGTVTEITTMSTVSVANVVTAVTTTSSQINEVAISGGTPVAVSTTLPASVVQLSQQGIYFTIITLFILN